MQRYLKLKISNFNLGTSRIYLIIFAVHIVNHHHAMNISYSWLKDYIDIDLSAGELAGILTGIGLEIEAVEEVEKIRGGLEGFVIGQVRSCEKHPDADKLSVTTVDIGGADLLNIVCGAPNVATGQKVVVAVPGTYIYRGDESFQIRKTKLRGVLSEGMICAEDEIGLGSNHEGILVLPDDAPIGMHAKKYFKVEPETVFTIGLTPNRIDSASHFGVARDLSAFLGLHRKVNLVKPDMSGFRVDNHDCPVDVVIENPVSCRRYAGVSISGITVAESPGWLKNRLRTIGMNPINNVVDITNFVLHELGQPLHAFDADELQGRMIIVRNLPEGTPFVTLDGAEHKLSADDLMICDAERPVAIGGVFGGLHSGVTENTRNVFLESAYFDPVSVRRTSKRHQINTDASFRFERGVDPGMTLVALKRCAMLIKEIAGGKVSSEIVDVHPNPLRPVKVSVSFAHIDRLIGKNIERNLLRSILESLEFEILHEDKSGYNLLVPLYRVDVTREADVIEEILRIYGYNNVEVPENLVSSLSYTHKPDQERLVDAISEYLCNSGFIEIMCNSLTKSAYYDNLVTYKPENLVHIMNPLSHDLNVMRQTLLFGGLETIIHNTNRQRSDLSLFEFGNCYTYHGRQDGKSVLANYREEQQLSLFISGRKYEPNWISREEMSNLYQMKAYVENVFAHLGIDIDQFTMEPLQNKRDLFSTGLCYMNGNAVMSEVAVVKKSLLNDFDIRNEVYYATLYWEKLVALRGDKRISFTELPRFPEVRRDLALLLDKDITYNQIRELAFKTERKLLVRMNLFDVYEGEQIEKGKKSYAVSFILHDQEATLTDERIDMVMKRLMDNYTRELGAEIR
jgi:phenylalanyl-tRNA synthetase beta chain